MKKPSRAVLASLFVGRTGSADHGTGRAAERRDVSLADPDRRIRSAPGMGGWQPALLCALAELQVRLGSGSGAREGARGERVAGGAKDCRRPSPMPRTTFPRKRRGSAQGTREMTAHWPQLRVRLTMSCGHRNTASKRLPHRRVCGSCFRMSRRGRLGTRALKALS
jgi:hypothetical protein